MSWCTEWASKIFGRRTFVLISFAKIGFVKSKKQVLAIVSNIHARKQGIEDYMPTVSKGWWQSFRKRHPQLTIHYAEQLTYSRAVATNREVVDTYFDLLEEAIDRNGLRHRPDQIFNCDSSDGGRILLVFLAAYLLFIFKRFHIF